MQIEEIGELASSRESFAALNKLKAGPFGYIRKAVNPKLKKPDGNLTETPEETATCFADHFEHHVFSRETIFENVTIDNMDQKLTNSRTGNSPSRIEFVTAIKKMCNNKAPGQSQVPADAFKLMEGENSDFFYALICRFWDEPDFDFEAFHQVTMKLLTRKRDLTDPNKWRAICLQEALSKIVSSIIQKRLVDHNKAHSKESQNGFWPGRGTADGVSTLKMALQTMREFGQDTYILFVDLVKAFDSVNREMLKLILLKYGVPANLVSVIMKMYTNVSIKFDIEDVKKTISSTSGVKQGDNLAPVLFLYVVQAVIDTWEQRWDEGNLPLRWLPPTNTGKDRGQLTSINWRNSGETFDINETLYADDAAFCFTSKEKLTKGTKLLQEIFDEFGLTIHIGTGFGTPEKEDSKTVAMFIPGAGSSTNIELAESPLIFNTEDKQYIPFVKIFCYLGTLITTNLRDDSDIDNRVRLAKGALAALKKNVLNCRSLPQKAKTRAFQSLCVSLLLAGCETWSLTSTQLTKLKTTYNDGLRAILGMNRYKAHYILRMTTTDLEKECNLPSLEQVLHTRKARWLGKIAKMKENRAPRKLLGAWVQCPRPTGRPQKTTKHGHLETINLVTKGACGPKGKFEDWMPLARDEKVWAAMYKTMSEVPQNALSVELC